MLGTISERDCLCKITRRNILLAKRLRDFYRVLHNHSADSDKPHGEEQKGPEYDLDRCQDEDTIVPSIERGLMKARPTTVKS